MRATSKLSLLIFVLLFLTACTASEFLIKRAINGFAADIVKELNSLADFNPQQAIQIQDLAADTDRWMRAQRLPLVQSSILTLATDIEQNGQIDAQNWQQLVTSSQQGLAISQAPHLINRYAELSSSLNDQQVGQVIESFDDELEKWLKKSQDRTIEKQNERIVDGLKWVFRAVKRPLTRAQRDYAKDFLNNRRVDFEYQRQLRIKETEQLRVIVMQAPLIDERIDKTQLNISILRFFEQIENSKSVPNQQDWQHNVGLFLQLINHFLADLNSQQRVDMAIVLRDYERIFDELSNAKE